MLALGLAGLLLIAGSVSAVLVVRLTGAEAETAVMAEQRAQVVTLARVFETCRGASCADLIAAGLKQTRQSALASATLLDGQLQVLAGDPVSPSGDLVDSLQGNQITTARVERAEGHLRGTGFDHRVIVPIRLADGRRAVIVAAFELDRLAAAVGERQQLVLLYLLSSFAGVLLFGIYASGRWFVRPIDTLIAAAAQIDAEAPDEGLIPAIDGPDEIARLADAVRDTVGRLRAANESQLASLSALEHAQNELVRSEKLATVGLLSAGVAHEIGNPLAAVIGYVEYLRGDEETPAELRAELLERMDRELGRIKLTIRELLDFSRPSTGTARPVELGDIARSAVELVHYQLKGIAISVEGQAQALVDPARIQQVFVNLLLNAADALAGNGQVWIRISTDGGQARADVADDGPGVGADEAAHLFEPFYSTKPKGQGTGLGLAICQRLVEEAGGRLFLSSAPGSGAIFSLTLQAPANQASSIS